MVEIDEHGNVQKIGPLFRISLRCEPDTLYGGRAFFLGYVASSSFRDFKEDQKQEEKSETFCYWLTSEFDASKENWEKTAGFSTQAPDCEPFVQVQFKKMDMDGSRATGFYLGSVYEKFKGVSTTPRGPQTQDKEKTGYYITLASDTAQLAKSRYMDTLTKEEQRGSPGRIGLDTLMNWYKQSRPGGAETDVQTLQRQVAVLIETIMRNNKSEHFLQALGKKELKTIRKV